MARPSTLPGLSSFLLLLGLALLVYLPAVLAAQFLNFDDPFFFGAQNGEFRAGGLALIFDPTATIAHAYLPVSHLSLYLDLQLFGLDPLGAHLHSLLLHALVALCLARLFMRLGLARAAALLAATVFLLHPALVESTVWVSSRKDLLSGLFSLLCLSALLTGRLHWLALYALLALYSKGTALVLPLLACALLLIRRQQGDHGQTKTAWQGVLILLVMSLLIGWHHASIASAQGTMVAAPLEIRLWQVPGAFLHYLTTALWPTGLNLLYPEVDTMQAFAENFQLGLWVLVGCGLTIILLRRRLPLVAGGLALFFLALTPFNTALPASAIAAADRYLYLAVPGLALALVSLPRIGLPLSIVAAFLCAIASASRARDFVDSEAVWRSSLEQDPDNAVALINLAAHSMRVAPEQLDEARALFEAAASVARYPEHKLNSERRLVHLELLSGRPELALEHAEQALLAAQALPKSPDRAKTLTATYLLAVRLNRQLGEEGRAAQLLEELGTLAPDHPGLLAYRSGLLLVAAVDDRGLVDPQDPRRQQAMALLARAEASSPENYQVNLVRGQWAFASARLFSAEKFFARACRIEPTRYEAYLGRAQLFLGQEMAADAERVIRAGIAAGAFDPQLLFLLGLSLAQQNRSSQARSYFEDYLDLRPGDPAASRALAGLLAVETMRELYQLDADELDHRAGRIADLDPENPKGYLIRAVAERHRGHPKEALDFLAKAAVSMPGDAEIRRLQANSERDRGYQLLPNEGRRELAMDHFLAFLELASEEMATDAVSGILRVEWRRLLKVGRSALLQGLLADAELNFRRCLVLVPDDLSPNLHLGLVLLQMGAGHEEPALACFRRAEAGQRRAAADPSLPVYYQIRTLTGLGRRKEAENLADAYLGEHDPAASARELERIRALKRALQQGR